MNFIPFKLIIHANKMISCEYLVNSSEGQQAHEYQKPFPSIHQL